MLKFKIVFNQVFVICIENEVWRDSINFPPNHIFLCGGKYEPSNFKLGHLAQVYIKNMTIPDSIQLLESTNSVLLFFVFKHSHGKTQRNIMSDFPGKIVDFSPCGGCVLFFF